MFYILLFLSPSIMTVAGDLKLELVQVLFRHGARTFIKSEVAMLMLLVRQQFVDESLLKNYGYEQLTNIGKAQAHKLGRVLRERYNDFLGPLYKTDDVYAYSSDNDRTKMSLQLVLAGLYPPAAEQRWHKELRWQPIPTHFVPPQVDLLLKATDMPKYRNHILETNNSFHGIESNVMKLDKFFKSRGLDKLPEYRTILYLAMFNVLSAHKASEGKLPDWYTDDLLNTLREHTVAYFDWMSSTPDMCKWNVGPLLRRFLDNMNVKNETTNPRKIYLYSGHELNIAAFTRAHGINEFKYPEFGSAVILEKFRDSQNQLYVRLLAFTENDGKFTALKLGKFEEFCPINEYLKIIENVTPSDEEIDSMYNGVTADLKSLHTSDYVFNKPKKLPSLSSFLGASI